MVIARMEVLHHVNRKFKMGPVFEALPFFCTRSFNEFNSVILRAVELLVNANTVGSSEFVGPLLVSVSAMMGV